MRFLFLASVLLISAVAPAQDIPAAPEVLGPAAPTLGSQLLAMVASPAGIGGISAIVATVLGLIFGANEVRRRRVALGVYHAFHIVEDAAAETDGEDALDKVAAGLKAVDQYMVANGWRPLKPGEQVVAKLGFSSMNGKDKIDEKVSAAAMIAADEARAAAKANPPPAS